MNFYHSVGSNHPRDNMLILLQFSFLALIALSIGQQREYPCPDQAEILPCVCIYVDYLLELDCSQVSSEEELMSVFTEAYFPLKDFHKFFLIHTSSSESTLDTLRVGTFSDVSFEMIEIDGTSYSVVEDDVFSNMTSRLYHIDMANNNISAFPFDDLQSLTSLAHLDLRANALGQAHLPVTVIEELYLQENNLDEDNFSMGATSTLLVLELGNNNFESVPDLTGLDMLSTFTISFNSIKSLENDTFADQKIKLAILDYNVLQSIHRDTFSGHLAYDATVDMVGNEFHTLDEEDWRPFLNELTLPGSLDLSDNPLLCGCDVAWLFADGGIALSKITQSTTCADGRHLHSLDPQIFVSLC